MTNCTIKIGDENVSIIDFNRFLNNYLNNTSLSGLTEVIDDFHVEEESTKPNTSEPKSFVLHSGGAVGADKYWGLIGKQYGISEENQKHYKTSDMPNGNTEVTEEDYNEGKIEAAKAAKRIFGYKFSSMKDGRLIRNWSQVKYADSIFAVGRLVPAGERAFPDQPNDTRITENPTVTGGTAYAVNMAILHNKPVYVYNQYDHPTYAKGWYKYDPKINDFVITQTPELTENFAGVGTRNINEFGKKAIEEVYENTFGKKIGQQNSEEPLNNINDFPKEIEEAYKSLNQTKTETGNVKVAGSSSALYIQLPTFKKENPNGIVAYRTEPNDLMKSLDKDNAIGNPFSYKANNRSGDGAVEATKMFLEWLETGNNFGVNDATAELRQAFMNKIRNTPKGSPILYYKELNQPSHANAIDYLVNKYGKDIGNQTGVKTFDNPRQLVMASIFENDRVRNFYYNKEDGKLYEESNKVYIEADQNLKQKVLYSAYIDSTSKFHIGNEYFALIGDIDDSGKVQAINNKGEIVSLNVKDNYEDLKKYDNYDKVNTDYELLEGIFQSLENYDEDIMDPLNNYLYNSYGIYNFFTFLNMYKNNLESEAFKRTMSNEDFEKLKKVFEETERKIIDAVKGTNDNVEFFQVDQFKMSFNPKTMEFKHHLKDGTIKDITNEKQQNKILAAYANKYPDKIKTITYPNTGNNYIYAVNRVISLSTFETITADNIVSYVKNPPAPKSVQPSTIDPELSFTYGDITVPTPFKLGYEQKKALENFIDFFNNGSDGDYRTLQGYAGTGKTAVIGILENYIRELNHKKVEDFKKGLTNEEPNMLSFIYLAPTHAATVQLSKALLKAGKLSLPDTVAKYNVKPPKQSDKKGNGFIIVDEASMVSQMDINTLLRNASITGHKVIFMGDPMQIPEVTKNSQNHKDLSSVFQQQDKISKLTKVFRQSDNDLLTNIERIRSNPYMSTEISIDNNDGSLVAMDTTEFFNSFFEDLGDNPEGTVYIAYTNDKVKEINQRAKFVLTRNDKVGIGDKIVGYLGKQNKTIEKGDVANSVQYKVNGYKLDGEVGYGMQMTFYSKELDSIRLDGKNIARPFAKCLYIPMSDTDSLQFSEEDYPKEKLIADREKFTEEFSVYYETLKDLIAKQKAAYSSGNKNEGNKFYAAIMQLKRENEHLEKVQFGDDYLYNPIDRKFINKRQALANGLVSIRGLSAVWKVAGKEYIVQDYRDIDFQKGIDYGYAITCHKSQGMTVDNVYVDVDNIQTKSSETPLKVGDKTINTERNALYYVAMSRAKDKTVVRKSDVSIRQKKKAPLMTTGGDLYSAYSYYVTKNNSKENAKYLLEDFKNGLSIALTDSSKRTDAEKDFLNSTIGLYLKDILNRFKAKNKNLKYSDFVYTTEFKNSNGEIVNLYKLNKDAIQGIFKTKEELEKELPKLKDC